MKKLIASVAALALMSGVALAQTRDAAASGSTPSAAPIGSAPSKDFTVTNYYKQDVYDRSDNKIGTIDDVLIDKNGDITALMISVGGFLGMGEKTVQTKFQNVQMTKKNDKWYLSMDASKDSLKAAPGYKYDRTATTWVPDTSDAERRTN
jgi:sporulation protein YlmC with PRC-barrel domain